MTGTVHRPLELAVPPRPLAEIDAEIKASQQRILKLLAEVTE